MLLDECFSSTYQQTPYGPSQPFDAQTMSEHSPIACVSPHQLNGNTVELQSSWQMPFRVDMTELTLIRVTRNDVTSHTYHILGE